MKKNRIYLLCPPQAYSNKPLAVSRRPFLRSERESCFSSRPRPSVRPSRVERDRPDKVSRGISRMRVPREAEIAAAQLTSKQRAFLLVGRVRI